MRDIVSHRRKGNVGEFRSRDNSVKRRYKNIERKDFARGDRTVPEIRFRKFRFFEIALSLFSAVARTLFTESAISLFSKIDRLGFGNIARILLCVNSGANSQQKHTSRQPYIFFHRAAFPYSRALSEMNSMLKKLQTDFINTDVLYHKTAPYVNDTHFID